MSSTRNLLLATVLMGLACVPTVLHSYLGITAVDDRPLEKIPLKLAGMDGRPSDRDLGWTADTYGTADVFERQYGAFSLFVARSYDAKSLYHHPELGVAYGDGYDRFFTTRLPEREDVPMFVLESDRGARSVYALVYKDQLVSDPIRFQLRQAASLLIQPRAPMTLFFVRRKAAPQISEPEDRAERLLVAAIDSFLALRAPATPR